MYNPRRQAKIALSTAYLLFALAVVHVGYIAYNALINGRSSIILFRSRSRFDYLFDDQLGQALLVLLVNIAFAIMMIVVARECYAEYKVWREN